MTIPMFIAALFHDVGISEFFDNIKFIPLCTPSDKKLDKMILLLHELVMYKFATYCNKCAIVSICHDKGGGRSLDTLRCPIVRKKLDSSHGKLCLQ
eukprot:8350092-Ditylum_brightwellii.AAC.1